MGDGVVWRATRRALFRLEPERAHRLAVGAAGIAGSTWPLRAALRAWWSRAGDPVEAFGLTFRNRVGLAAGYDKDGRGWRGLAALGFGHLEIGTVTPRAQPGNPRPRVHRLVADQAVINRMGFPGDGSAAVAERLHGARAALAAADVRLGVNIGKQASTPLDEAAGDYVLLVGRFASLCDYLVVNVSSPNTEGLRRLQARQALGALLGRIDEARQTQVKRLKRPVPVLVKLSPDLDEEALEDALDAILEAGMDGVVATNTTVSRPPLSTPGAAELTGGLSGAPLRSLSAAVLASVRRRVGPRFPVIASGGIMSADDARDRVRAGADLVQLYTGLVYHGPGLVRDVVRGLRR